MSIKSFFTRQGPDNKDVTLDPWAKPSDNGNQPAAGTPPNPPAPPNGDGTPPDHRKILVDAMRKQGLYDGLSMGDFMTAVEKNDPEAMGAFFEKIMENAALVSITMADKLTASKLEKAQATAVDTATKSTKRQLLMEEMFEKLPFTNEAALKPVAEQALDGFLAQGKSPKEAIDSVAEFFKATALTAGSAFGMKMEQKGGNGLPDSGGFRGASGPFGNNNNDEPEEPEWVSIFTGGAKTEADFEEPDGSQNNAA